MTGTETVLDDTYGDKTLGGIEVGQAPRKDRKGEIDGRKEM